MTEILQSYKYDPARQEHDTTATYISLDPSHTLRIALSSTATECAIDISLEVTSDIKNATHETLPEPYANKRLTSIENLRHIVTILGISLDHLREFYGDPPKHYKQYILSQHSLSKELAIPTPVLGQPHKSEIEGISQSTEVGLDSVGGATYAKHRLAELAAIINQPAEAAEFDIQGSHFLLHGPPGTGKTSLINAFSREVNATLLEINSSEIVDKWVGASGKNIKRVFEKAKKGTEPLVIFFDEFDTLAHRSGAGAGERTDVRKLLNTEIEDITNNHPNIIIAAATNAELDSLESSLIRSGRIEPISVPLPTEQERYDIFGIILFKSMQRATQSKSPEFDSEGFYLPPQGFTLYSPDINIAELAQRTDGMTGSDFEVVLSRVRKKHFMHFKQTGEKKSVTQQDLLNEIQQFGR